jgi:hypothetical protein
MPTTAFLLASLDTISHEATLMLAALDAAGDEVRQEDRREAKRRVTVIREEAQAMLDWLSEVRLEEPRN